MERKVTEQVLSSQKNARRPERSGGLLDRLFERREKGLWSFLTWSFFLSQMVGAEQASAAAARSAGMADETASTNDANAGQAAGNAFLPPGPFDLAEIPEAAAQPVQSLTQAAAPANVLAAPAEFAAPAEMRSTDESSACTADQRGRRPGGNSAGSDPLPRSPSIRSLAATCPAWAVRPCPPSGSPPVVEDVIAPVVGIVGDVVGDVVHVLDPVIEQVVAPVIGIVGDVVGDVVHVLDPVVEQVVAPVIGIVGDVVGDVVHVLDPVVEQVVAPVIGIVGDVVGDVVHVLDPVVEQVVAPVIGIVGDVVGDVVQVLDLWSSRWSHR